MVRGVLSQGVTILERTKLAWSYELHQAEAQQSGAVLSKDALNAGSFTMHVRFFKDNSAVGVT